MNDDANITLRKVLVPTRQTTSSIWECNPAPTRPAVRTHPIDPAFDNLILDTLAQAPAPGETIARAYQRKEAALLTLFSELDVPAARAVHVRLSLPKPNDTVAEMFGRLTSERRGRLLDFLADVRRRRAMAGHRR